MTDHEAIRNLLPLAAAGALEAPEEERVAGHAATCAACAAELERWRQLAGALRRLPTPVAPAGLVERTRARLERQIAAEAEHRWNYSVTAFLVLFCWTLTLASWPIVRLLAGGMLSWLDVSFTQSWYGLVGYTMLVWAVGAVAAVMLGLRQRQERKTA